jgi:glycosyltransferase involved in cell wall biosynthesis
MSSEPRLSICIPAYERPIELGQAITSVLEQEIADVEVVVTDDSSRPLRELVAALADRRVRYVHNEHRLGMAGNWERAVRLAQAPLIGLLMDDDRLLPDFASAVLDAFDAHAPVDVVFTNHSFDDGVHSWTRDCPLRAGRYTDFLPYLLEQQPVAVSATVMTRETWQRVLPLPDLLTADVFIHATAAEAGFVFQYIDRPLMMYRCHGGQLSASSSRFRDDGVEVWRRFAFSDAGCEATRYKRLSEALASRGKLRLQAHDVRGARQDLEEAAQLAQLDRRARIALALSRSRILSSIAVRAWRTCHPQVRAAVS